MDREAMDATARILCREGILEGAKAQIVDEKGDIRQGHICRIDI
jgi:hypothetical protein